MTNPTPPTSNAGRKLAALVGVIAAAGLLKFVPAEEGTVLHTYRDVGGVLTYCTGATEDAMAGRVYTIEECRARLDIDLAEHAQGVMNCVHHELTDGQKIAFVSAAYNIGVPAFCSSSMARKANQGDMPGACAALSLWDKVKGKPIAGLTKRRARERSLCEGKA